MRGSAMVMWKPKVVPLARILNMMAKNSHVLKVFLLREGNSKPDVKNIIFMRIIKSISSTIMDLEKKQRQKSEGLPMLRDLALAHSRSKHPSLPDYARTIHNYSDRTANGLTRAVIDFLRISGHQAERINCTGKMVDNTKIMTDVLGDKRSIGSVRWLPSSGQKGTADVSCVIYGRAIKIEIKIGKDRQSEDQKKYQSDIERAGGLYFIIKSFDQFMDLYNELL